MYTHQLKYKNDLREQLKFVTKLVALNVLSEEELRIVDPYLKECQKYNEYTTTKNHLFTNHPLVSYMVTKHLTVDWTELINKLRNTPYLQKIKNARKLLEFPIYSNYQESLKQLLLLQDVYLLNTSDVADGYIMGLHAGFQLSSEECFFIGKECYGNQDYKHAEIWLTEALRRLDTESKCDKVDMLEKLAYAKYKRNNINDAITLADELLMLNSNKTNYKKMFENHKKSGKVFKINDFAHLKDDDGFDDVYLRLCRGEQLLDGATLSKLKCRYTDKNHPYLRIGPVKEETLVQDPLVRVYHDIIYDNEMETMKKLGSQKFKTTKKSEYTSGYRDVEDSRIQQYAWLTWGDEKLFKKYMKRMEIVSGLTVKYTYENIQMAFYGPGGYFSAHRDHQDDTFFRIATWLAYINDVEYGGYTAFMKAKQKVTPVKGSAVFWYNLFRDGTGDDLTEHAACPVLLGYKWISAQWINMKGNEFNRPCGLNWDD